MKTTRKKWLLLIVSITGLVLLLKFTSIKEYLSFQSLKNNREYILAWVNNHYVAAVGIYIFFYIVSATFSLPFAVPLTIIGGYLFGVIFGTLYTNIGATVGATCTFLLFRNYLGTLIQNKYAINLAKFNQNIEYYGIFYLLFARLIAIIPFFLVNILASLTTISVKDFMWTTSLGIIPGSLLYAYAGKNIADINDPKEIFSSKVILAILLLVLFSIVSLLLRRWLGVKMGSKNNSNKL